MPKLKRKILTATLYTYVEPRNRSWVKKQAKYYEVSYSAYINRILSDLRVNSRRGRFVTLAP